MKACTLSTELFTICGLEEVEELVDRDPVTAGEPQVPPEGLDPMAPPSSMSEGDPASAQVSGIRESASPPPRSLTARILALALPALGALIAEPLLVLIDSAMVGHLGTAELAGLALASTIVQTIVGVFVFLAYSTTALAARSLGAGRPDLAVRSGIEAMWLAAGLGAVAAGALIGAGPWIVSALGADASVAPHALAYLRTSAPGLVGMFIVLAATGTLRGLLDTKTPFVVAIGGSAFNVVANAVLIYGMGWGIAGSGAGTALSQSLMAVALVWVVVRGARKHGVSLASSSSGMWEAAKDGAPLLVRTIALRLALIGTVSTATVIGVQALAAHQVVFSLWSFAAFVLDALAIAAQAMVGFAIGAGDRAHLRDLVRRLAWWGAGAGVVVGLGVGAASPWLPWAFGSDPQMHRVASAALIIAAAFMPLGGVVFLLDGVLIGAGQGKYLAVAGVVTLAVYVPALLTIRAATMTHSPMDVEGQILAMVWLWVAFAGLFMGARALANSWRTWWAAQAIVR